MNLPKPLPQYDSQNEAQARAALAQADEQSYKRGRDIQLASNQRLIMPNDDGAPGVLSIVAGVPTWTAL